MSEEKIVSLTEQGNYGLGANVISEDEKKKVEEELNKSRGTKNSPLDRPVISQAVLNNIIV